jgi:hypothetical protein
MQNKTMSSGKLFITETLRTSNEQEANQKAYWVPNRNFANQPIPVGNLVDVGAGAIIKLRTVDFACQECHCSTPQLHNTSFNPGSDATLTHYLKTVAARRQSPTGGMATPR